MKDAYGMIRGKVYLIKIVAGAMSDQELIKMRMDLQRQGILGVIVQLPDINALAIAEQKKDIPVERVWEILSKVKGCKPNKEDCVFNKCHKWGECELLTKALKKELGI